MPVSKDFKALLMETRACRACADVLPLGPKPILQVHPDARLLIASQAPGRIAHASGIPFQDPSGRRLRDWMGIDETAFYDPHRVAIVPMGLCYPGRGNGGDLPPRPECAPLWRNVILDKLARVRLTLVIGAHAQRWHGVAGRSVADAIGRWRDHRTAVVPLPHPSPRNNGWLAGNGWFERDVVPLVRQRVERVLVDCPR